ncbi:MULTISPECIES: tetratricopeptide repeat protein [Helicobacter]|uniref:beta-lactamase n=1 Tax=Helicobacter heilmannii TaxID=35817 RepID=A0A0K2YEB9_HELHE|nr:MULTISPECIES: SEL1-like repeat protein [Helicobacter]BDQ28135.1 hypothetical protein ASB1_18110 [Helicobacter heilmannii]GLH58547.1 hypothetical protein NHP214376_13380 [Helicobacter ailurogastricus]GLH60025.1 hypothetical protein NHP214377_12970 [Helicobacter ailurogastricus]CRI35320.1 hypothetical protein HHE01_03180 [Helicobacter heilmannii]
MSVAFKKCVLRVLLGLAVVFGVCYADSKADKYYKMAKSYNSHKDYAKALHYWQALADIGDVRGYNGLGIAYYMGEGVAKDYDKAIQYFQKAAKMQGTKSSKKDDDEPTQIDVVIGDAGTTNLGHNYRNEQERIDTERMYGAYQH